LPRSKRWVEGDYNEWQLPRGMRDDDDEEAYSDDDSEDDSDSDDDSDASVLEHIEANAAFADNASTSS
jgi:RNA polymerase I-specific transcription initiation factor RRN3